MADARERAESASLVKQLMGGVDLTGDPDYCYSRVFSGAMLCLVIERLLSEVRVFNRVDFQGVGDFRSFVVFLTAMGACGLNYLAAAIVSIGNARHPSKGAKARAAFTIVMCTGIVTLAVCEIYVLRRRDDKEGFGKIVDDVLNAVCAVLVVGSGLVCVGTMAMRCLGREELEPSALPAALRASEGRWGPDDVLGLSKYAGVRNSYFSPENHELVQGPDTVPDLKDFLFPQPFSCQNRFPEGERLKEVAKSVQIVYPVRLVTASFLVAFTAVGISICAFAQCGALLSDEDRIAGPLESFGLLYTPKEMREVEALLSTLKTAPNGTASETYKFVDELYREAKSDRTWWIDEIRSWCTVALVVGALSACIVLWFIFVAKLAFRKAMLELALSSPSYRVSERSHNAGRDKGVVSNIITHLAMALLLLWLAGSVVGRLLAAKAFWRFLFVDQLSKTVAFFSYLAFTILVVPTVYNKLVLDEKRQTKSPRLRAALMFIFELYYVPAALISVLVKALKVLAVVIVSFLRPDLPAFPVNFRWLDSPHATYVSAIYAQLRTGMARAPQTVDEEPEAPTPLKTV